MSRELIALKDAINNVEQCRIFLELAIELGDRGDIRSGIVLDTFEEKFTRAMGELQNQVKQMDRPELKLVG